MNYKNTRYSPHKVAELLGVYKRTLFNWEAAGKIPKARRDPMNNYRYYLAEDIVELRKITKR
jgi:DNA-binding transcriptional MerR regulator